MPCNCGSKSKKYTYVYTAPTGQTKTYNTEVEARAAVIRNNGGTVSTKAA
jgi:hypothetical protein